MAYAHARRDDYRPGGTQYSEGQRSDPQRERDHRAEERGDYSAVNHPQHGTASNSYRQPNNEYQGLGPVHARLPAYVSRKSGNGPASALSPPRFADHDVVRGDYFGYPEIERHAHGFEPYSPSGGTSRRWYEPPGLDHGYDDFGVPWQSHGYPRHVPRLPDSAYAGTAHGNDYERTARYFRETNFGTHREQGHDATGASSYDYWAHTDPDYHQWRLEQIRNLDRDYENWRQERYGKFSSDFDSWRAKRPHGYPSQTGESSSSAVAPLGSTDASLAGASSTSGTKS